jgi:hypothetical protein
LNGDSSHTPLEILAERVGVDPPLALGAFDHGRLAGLADVDRLDRHRRALRPGDSERPQPPLIFGPAGLVDGRNRHVGRIHPLGQVPQSFPPEPPGDRDLGAHHQELQRLGDVALVGPAGRGPRHHGRVGDVA